MRLVQSLMLPWVQALTTTSKAPKFTALTRKLTFSTQPICIIQKPVSHKLEPKHPRTSFWRSLFISASLRVYSWGDARSWRDMIKANSSLSLSVAKTAASFSGCTSQKRHALCAQTYYSFLLGFFSCAGGVCPIMRFVPSEARFSLSLSHYVFMPRRDALCDVATCAANWLARFSTQPRTSKIIYIKNKTHTRTTVWMLSVRLVNFRKMRVTQTSSNFGRKA